jgi:hypothetical protein
VPTEADAYAEVQLIIQEIEKGTSRVVPAGDRSTLLCSLPDPISRGNQWVTSGVSQLAHLVSADRSQIFCALGRVPCYSFCLSLGKNDGCCGGNRIHRRWEIGVMVNGNCRRWLPEYGYRGRYGDTRRKRQLPELDY